MYTEAGNRAVDAMLARVCDRVQYRVHLVTELRNQIERVKRRHPEVEDTEPERYIVDIINDMCAQRGWLGITRRDLY